jgi:hypothetical protein
MENATDTMELSSPNLIQNRSKERHLKWSPSGEKKERLERN